MFHQLNLFFLDVLHIQSLLPSLFPKENSIKILALKSLAAHLQVQKSSHAERRVDFIWVIEA